jgi:hypothetical protein
MFSNASYNTNVRPVKKNAFGSNSPEDFHAGFAHPGAIGGQNALSVERADPNLTLGFVA